MLDENASVPVEAPSQTPLEPQTEAPPAEFTRPVGAAPVAEPAPVEQAPKRLTRGFVCPSIPNLNKLIRIGKLHQVADPQSPTGFKDWGRRGDVFIAFKNGYWTGGNAEDDDVRIAWCEQEALQDDPLVMDIMHPQAKVWSELKKGQQVTGRRDPTVSPSVDVTKAIRGEVSLEAGTDVIDQVRETLERDNEGLS